MGSLSIQKGKRAERAVASMLNPIVERVCLEQGVDPLRLCRNLRQSQQGGYDLDGLDWIAIEIKHHKVVALGSWWVQTLRQAGRDLAAQPIVGMVTREPVLIWKQHGGKWNVRMLGLLEIETGRRLRTAVDISWDAFVVWFEKRCEVETRKIELDEENGCTSPGLFG